MSEIKHILVVDDDARLRQLLLNYLSKQGWFVSVASDAVQARRFLAAYTVDAMILDRMMPGENGLQLAQSLRENPVPILMLTAMGEGEQRIEGLEAGVADYLVKPFEPKELVLRLQNILQTRSQPKAAAALIGPYRFDAQRLCLLQDDAEIFLTETEAAYLQTLLEHAGQPVSRETLAASLGQADQHSSGRHVDVQINRLRKKMEPNPNRPSYIHTVRGAGYVLRAGG